MDTEHKIEVTGVDLPTFIRAAYALSRPQGLGHLHFKPGPLPTAELEAILARIVAPYDKTIAISMDYVLGRAVKMTMWNDGERRFIRNIWYDHSAEELAELLRQCGMSEKANLIKEFS